jgi:hypothetical protein
MMTMNYFVKRIILSLLLIQVISANASPRRNAYPPEKSRIYFVVVENVPDDIYKKIIYKSFEIGEILSKELIQNGSYVQIRIRIYESYVPFIHTNATFYFDDSILKYYAFEPSGDLLEEDSKILGFKDEMSLDLARAKMKLQELYKSFRDWSEEVLDKIIE